MACILSKGECFKVLTFELKLSDIMKFILEVADR